MRMPIILILTWRHRLGYLQRKLILAPKRALLHDCLEMVGSRLHMLLSHVFNESHHLLPLVVLAADIEALLIARAVRIHIILMHHLQYRDGLLPPVPIAAHIHSHAIGHQIGIFVLLAHLTNHLHCILSGPSSSIDQEHRVVSGHWWPQALCLHLSEKLCGTLPLSRDFAGADGRRVVPEVGLHALLRHLIEEFQCNIATASARAGADDRAERTHIGLQVVFPELLHQLLRNRDFASTGRSSDRHLIAETIRVQTFIPHGLEKAEGPSRQCAIIVGPQDSIVAGQTGLHTIPVHLLQPPLTMLVL
mmetsp:Transcript_42720/g.79477  ORF Transcript_42720/g.79477 Transcript_42720/m.79477 type:complete len:305 (-) Transcript_42720:72-986(-)